MRGEEVDGGRLVCSLLYLSCRVTVRERDLERVWRPASRGVFERVKKIVTAKGHTSLETSLGSREWPLRHKAPTLSFVISLRVQMAEAKIKLVNIEPKGLLVRVEPPQTNDIPNFTAGKGAYCFVIDVSGSMNAAAAITTDDGDKVNHGWSQLDIAKHSTNTFVASLGDTDYVCVVTYSDGAKVWGNGPFLFPARGNDALSM